ncbi:hypothetical protein HQ865_17160 [Mucilaginibacter mali]|uniref:DUF5672 domain-containing protein n=1 Tax=Mucilaginibacter mali TaxID=2740462 RepID=A0A7D4UPY5_9SPHI|nr:DUF5672 family protein [Mucilaginibacter mali]QKJ31420.1 hypothetical protein HQ865_17160 [Mucilaginibacter mali]
MKQVAVIIPFYKDSLSDYEKIALQQCRRILPTHDIIAVKPQSLNANPAAQYVEFTDVLSFDDSYFNGLAGYNSLMMSAGFYGRFADYEYILIYQMDAFVFKDELAYWCDEGYDYIGAPWITKTYHKSPPGLALLAVQRFFAKLTGSKSTKYLFENKVGNGGFSLRQVQRFHDLCISMKPTIDHYLSQSGHLYNEDVFWSFEPARQHQKFKVPDRDTALRFAFEVPLKSALNAPAAQLPFGCHDWDRYADFWRPIFKRYGYDI